MPNLALSSEALTITRAVIGLNGLHEQFKSSFQAPVVQKLDNAIHRINHYPADSAVCFVDTYPLDSDLSGG